MNSTANSYPRLLLNRAWPALLALAVFLLTACSSSQPTSASLTPAPIDGNIRGYPSAKLTVVVWNDFQ